MRSINRLISRKGPTTTRRTPASQPASAPRLSKRVTYADGLADQKMKWAKDKETAFKLAPDHPWKAEKTSESTLAPSWKEVWVDPAELDQLAGQNYQLMDVRELYGIGKLKTVVNSNAFDMETTEVHAKRQTRKPGDGPFDGVVTSSYGCRNQKYLFAIDHEGMHVVPEMIPVESSSRGVPMHSMFGGRAVIGGEIYFDEADPGKVSINFGSSRFPIENNRQAEATIRFILSLGYHTVVAALPDRDISTEKYGKADRFGDAVQNVVYRRKPAPEREPL